MPHLFRKPFFSSAVSAGLRAAGILGLGAGVLAGGTGLLSAPAGAQGLFGYWDTPQPAPKPRKIRRAPPSITEDVPEKGKSKVGTVADRPATGPLVINVSLSRQRLTVYDSSGAIAESPVSSGRVGYSTPTGVFTVLEKQRMHHSNLYSGAPMPNMQRITWSGVALHAGVLPGYPASHGCIRLPHGFSKKLYGMTRNGTRVIVTRDPVAPRAIAHERLFGAFPPEDGLAAAVAAPTKVADASPVTAASGEAVSAVLGVSPAAAAAADASPAASYRARKRAEAERLSAEIRTAGYAWAEKRSVLMQAQKEAAAARAPLVAARAEADRLSEALGALEKAKATGERELALLQNPVEEKPDRKRRQRKAEKVDPAQRIAELTEELAELPADIAAARSAWERADAAFKTLEAAAAAAEQKRRAAMADLAKTQAALDQALAKEEAAKRLEARRHLPVSVFISRAKQRLYIRQGYDDILDVAVTFDRPDEPVGTHVFTALDFTEDRTAMKWSVVSVPHDPARASRKKDKQARKEQDRQLAALDLKGQTAAAALDRITVPEDVREQIADVMKPGSSVVISDLGIGNETGKHTDFIVPIR